VSGSAAIWIAAGAVCRGQHGNLTVRASAALPIAASYRIIARRLDLPRVPEVDFAVTHPAGSTAVTVLFPGQSLPTGQWQFSLQLPDFSPFQVGDSATAFISTPSPEPAAERRANQDGTCRAHRYIFGFTRNWRHEWSAGCCTQRRFAVRHRI